MFKVDPATAFAANPLAMSATGGGGGVIGSGGGGRRAGVGMQRVIVLLSILLFVLLCVRQVVYDSVARLSVEDAAVLRGRATGKVFVEGDPVSLAVVYPFYPGDVERVEANLAGWGGPRNGAHKACSSKYAHHTTLVFYFNFDINHADNRRFEQRLTRAAKPIARCFRRVQFESAKLNPEEDKYPVGMGKGGGGERERGLGDGGEEEMAASPFKLKKPKKQKTWLRRPLHPLIIVRWCGTAMCVKSRWSLS